MEEVKIQEVAEEIKNASTEELEQTIKDWFEKTRTQSMKIGAKFISTAIFGIIQKHTKKPGKVSLRDYERCITEILKVIQVQLKNDETQQNDSEEVVKENENDRTTE